MTKVLQLKNNFHTNKLLLLLKNNATDREILSILYEIRDENIHFNVKELSRFAIAWVKKGGTRVVMEVLIELGVDLDFEENGLNLWQMAFFKESIAFSPRLMDLIVMNVLGLDAIYLPAINKYIDQAMEIHETLLDTSYIVIEREGKEPDLLRHMLDIKYDEMMKTLVQRFNELAGLA